MDRGRNWHGHEDHTSVTLSARGRPVLTEAGFGGYGQGEYRTGYLWSPEAHNVLTVPGERFLKGQATRLVRQGSAGAAQFFEAEHTAYGGRVRRRGVYVDPTTAAPFLLVRDVASRGGPGAFEQLWHLPHGSSVTLSGHSKAIALSADRGLQTTILQVALPGQTLLPGATSVVSGRTSPMQGWMSRRDREKVAAPVVVARRVGRSTHMVTVVVPTRPGVPVTASAVANGAGCRVVVTIGSVRRTVNISPGGALYAG